MYKKARRKLILPFLLPQTIFYIVLVFIPLFLTVVYGFTNWKGHVREFDFVGFHNFSIILKDRFFFNAVKNTFYYAIVGGVLMLVSAMAIAWALHERIKARSFFRFIVLAPMVLSASVVGLMWKWMYNPTFGLFNPVLKAIGLSKYALPWLGEPRTALTAIIITTVWYNIGLWVLLLSAGLARIPDELFDAAKIDGAGDWKVFTQITIPLMWESIRIVLTLWIIRALQVFTTIYVMTGGGVVGSFGGPMGSTEVMASYVYKNAFSSFNWGYAMALATGMLVMIFVITTIGRWLSKREVFQY